MADELKPVYLITGGDRPKIQRAVERLRARFDADGTEHFSAEETSGDEVVASCNALGLFAAAGRLVLVTEVDGHRNRDDRMVGGWKAADVKAVVDYLKAPTPDTVLALVGEEVKKDSPLGKACAKVGDVLVYEAEKKKLTAWVVAQFKDLGAKAQPDACRLLLDLVGENTDELRLEVEKLALWAEGGELTAEDVEEMVAPRGPRQAVDADRCVGRARREGRARRVRPDAPPRRNAERACVGALRPRRARVGVQRVRRRGHPPGRGGEAAEAAQRVPRAQGVRPGRAMGSRRAALGDRAPRRS